MRMHKQAETKALLKRNGKLPKLLEAVQGQE